MSPTRIAVTTGGADGGRSGIGSYVINLLAELPEADDRTEWDVLVRDEDQHLVPDAPRMRSRRVPAATRHPIVDLAWHQLALPAICRRGRYAAVLLPAANRRLPRRAPCVTVGTVHDLAPLRLDRKYDPLRQTYVRHVLPALIRRLDHVITVSECSKRDIMRYADVSPDRITVIPNGVDHRRFYPQAYDHTRLRRQLGITRPFVLYVARLEHPGKNHVPLIRAFERFKCESGAPHQLVLAGGDWTRTDAIHRAAASSPCRADIRLPGWVPGKALPELYAAADLFVFPSLYEGFGLPVLEAMASGTPVICADRASLPEVAGDAALLFDPSDITSMADAMRLLLTDPAQHAVYRQRGLAQAARFTWRATARKTLEVLHHAIDHA